MAVHYKMREKNSCNHTYCMILSHTTRQKLREQLTPTATPTTNGFVTFIIPSLNRPSLHTAIQSLLHQTDQNWKCIVIFDGLDHELKISDALKDKIKFVNHEKIGIAGPVRNAGLPLVNTAWTAFLDDDDVLKPTYVSFLKQYANADPQLEVIHFTIEWPNGSLEPNPNQSVDINCGGVSFAVKTSLIIKHNLQFNSNRFGEDRYFFVQCRDLGKCLVTYNPQYLALKRSEWRTADNATTLQIHTPIKLI